MINNMDQNTIHENLLNVLNLLELLDKTENNPKINIITNSCIGIIKNYLKTNNMDLFLNLENEIKKFYTIENNKTQYKDTIKAIQFLIDECNNV